MTLEAMEYCLSKRIGFPFVTDNINQYYYRCFWSYPAYYIGVDSLKKIRYSAKIISAVETLTIIFGLVLDTYGLYKVVVSDNFVLMFLLWAVILLACVSLLTGMQTFAEKKVNNSPLKR